MPSLQRTALFLPFLCFGTSNADGIIRSKRRNLDEDSPSLCLWAEFARYPEIENPEGPPEGMDPLGTATAKFADAETVDFDFSFNVDGLESKCVDCGIHVHTGMSCATHPEVLGHYYSMDFSEDPWNDVLYTSNGKGKAKGKYKSFSDGFNYAEHIGHAVVVHGEGGVRVGCGVLKEIQCSKIKDEKKRIKKQLLFEPMKDNDKVVTACIGAYPEYDDSIPGMTPPTGMVRASFKEDGKMMFAHFLENLEARCKDCGIHIHAGTTCASHAEVQGHYWTPVEDEDPWNFVFYRSNKEGKAVGIQKRFKSGFDFDANRGHAVVVHTFEGVRIGCGVFQDGFVDCEGM